MSSSILLGFMALLLSYHIFYLPFFLMRGSYRTASWIWFAVATVVTILLVLKMIKQKEFSLPKLTKVQIFSVCAVSVIIVFICIFISLHVPAYGTDIDYYISSMNRMYHNDVMWIDNGSLSVHNGINSLFGLMTFPALISGIRPYYLSVFMMRILLVILTSMAIYRNGKIIFNKNGNEISQSALWMCVFVTMFLMFWNSMYQAHFYFRRSNEAKAYCQFILLPLGFSLFVNMCKEGTNRKALWKEQVLIGMSAVAMSMSSLTSYPLLVFIGFAAILAYDRFKGIARTALFAMLCAAPNLLYTVFYYLVKNSYIVL